MWLAGPVVPVQEKASSRQPLALTFDLSEFMAIMKASGARKSKGRLLAHQAWIKLGSGVCVRRGGGWPMWLCRSWWSSCSKSRAGVFA